MPYRTQISAEGFWCFRCFHKKYYKPIIIIVGNQVHGSELSGLTLFLVNPCAGSLKYMCLMTNKYWIAEYIGKGEPYNLKRQTISACSVDARLHCSNLHKKIVPVVTAAGLSPL